MIKGHLFWKHESQLIVQKSLGTLRALFVNEALQLFIYLLFISET